MLFAWLHYAYTIKFVRKSTLICRLIWTKVQIILLASIHHVRTLKFHIKQQCIVIIIIRRRRRRRSSVYITLQHKALAGPQTSGESASTPDEGPERATEWRAGALLLVLVCCLSESTSRWTSDNKNEVNLADMPYKLPWITYFFDVSHIVSSYLYTDPIMCT